MPIYRILCSKDTFVTNAIQPNADSQSLRATGSNFGKSPVLEVFKLTGTLPGATVELARSLLQFNITELSGKIFDEKVIPSSSVNYKLKLFDYPTGREQGSSYYMCVYPISRSWDEGNGIDIDNYHDWGFCNWLSASSVQCWTQSGSDYYTNDNIATGFVAGSGSAYFDYGCEDLETDVTRVVNNWLSHSIGNIGVGMPNYGLLVMLSGVYEENNLEYKLKAFHGRETKFVDKVPYLEAQWDDALKDNRGNFGYNNSSSLYFYNYVRGELTDATEPVMVRIRDHFFSSSASFNLTLTASKASIGVYSCSLYVSNTASFSGTFYDTWYSGSYLYMSANFSPLVLTGSDVDVYRQYDVSVANLKRIYRSDEEARIKVVVSNKNYMSHVRPSASLSVDKQYIEKMYYSVINNEDNSIIIPFGTGSTKYTQLSYNKDGNYFNFWFSSLLPGFQYRFVFMIDINKNDKKFYDDNKFIFKVI